MVDEPVGNAAEGASALPMQPVLNRRPHTRGINLFAFSLLLRLLSIAFCLLPIAYCLLPFAYGLYRSCLVPTCRIAGVERLAMVTGNHGAEPGRKNMATEQMEGWRYR